MALIPSNTRFIGIATSVDLTEKKSSVLNNETQSYTIEDLAGFVAGTASYGQVSKMNSATIPVVTQSVYQSTGLTGTLNTLKSGVSLGTTDTFAIKNTSGITKVFEIYGSIDMGVSISGDTIMGIKIALNGVPIDETECRAWSIGGKAGKLVTNWMIELNQNDEVALYVANFTNTNDISFSRGRLVAKTIK